MPIFNPPPQDIPQENHAFMRKLVDSVYQLFYASGGQDGAVRVPSITTDQRDALKADSGMVIYNSTTNAFNFYENGSWVTK